jgi:hypothetical protein
METVTNPIMNNFRQLLDRHKNDRIIKVMISHNGETVDVELRGFPFFITIV